MVGHLAHGGGDRGQRPRHRAGHRVAEHRPGPPPPARPRPGAVRNVRRKRSRSVRERRISGDAARRPRRRPARAGGRRATYSSPPSAGRAGAAVASGPVERRPRARAAAWRPRRGRPRAKATSLSVSAPELRRPARRRARSPGCSVPRTSGGSAPMVIGHRHHLQHAVAPRRGRSWSRGRPAPRRRAGRRATGPGRPASRASTRARRGPVTASSVGPHLRAVVLRPAAARSAGRRSRPPPSAWAGPRPGAPPASASRTRDAWCCSTSAAASVQAALAAPPPPRASRGRSRMEGERDATARPAAALARKMRLRERGQEPARLHLQHEVRSTAARLGHRDRARLAAPARRSRPPGV